MKERTRNDLDQVVLMGVPNISTVIDDDDHRLVNRE